MPQMILIQKMVEVFRYLKLILITHITLNESIYMFYKLLPKNNILTRNLILKVLYCFRME